MFPPNTSTFSRPGGVVGGRPWDPKPPAPPPGSNIGQNYVAAVNTQGKDYDSMMKNFQNMFDSSSNSLNDLSQQYKNLMSQQYQPQQEQYKPTADVTEALNRYKGMADTGGYSPEDLANIRARSVSPIRAAYANAKMQIERQKSLGGGYSPNQGILLSRMARQQGAAGADAMTGANANIAQMVAEGKRAGLSGFGGLAETEAGAGRDIGARNVEAQNKAGVFNKTFGADILDRLKGLSSEDWQKKMQALTGQTSLYGTNPALVRTFGDQAMGAAQLDQNARNTAMQAGGALSSQWLRR